jgi:hypothetical protein
MQLAIVLYIVDMGWAPVVALMPGMLLQAADASPRSPAMHAAMGRAAAVWGLSCTRTTNTHLMPACLHACLAAFCAG